MTNFDFESSNDMSNRIIRRRPLIQNVLSEHFKSAIKIASRRDNTFLIDEVSHSSSYWKGDLLYLISTQGELIDTVGSQLIQSEMSQNNLYFKAWINSFNFQGRSSRKDYWSFQAIDFLILFIFAIALPFTGSKGEINPVFYSIFLLYSFVCIFPRLSILIRRIRDTGRSWKTIFYSFIPIVGPILILIWTLDPSLERSLSSQKLIDKTIDELDNIQSLLDDEIIGEDEYKGMRKKILGI